MGNVSWKTNKTNNSRYIIIVITNGCSKVKMLTGKPQRDNEWIQDRNNIETCFHKYKTCTIHPLIMFSNAAQIVQYNNNDI